MMKKRGFIVFLILAAGCSGGLKQSWNDFSAYYNTFYNTKKYFNAALNQLQTQPVQIDISQVARPHRPPLGGADENFAHAIANATELIQRFPKSKWVDDALLVKGKAHYFRKEFFLALQNFKEIESRSVTNAMMKQETALWKSRTLLDLGSFQQAIAYLEQKLNAPDLKWTQENRAEAHVLLAEHYAMLDNWKQTAQQLEQWITKVEDDGLQARSYFLWGQALQQMQDYNHAYQAFNKAMAQSTHNAYRFWVEIKKAELSEIAGRRAQALAIYSFMLQRENSTFQQKIIYFRLAQFHHQQRAYTKAEQEYKYVIEDGGNLQLSRIQAQAYYELGQLYRKQYHDYSVAFAYYDSALTMREALPEEKGDRWQQAQAYREYSLLRDAVHRIERQLQMASLSVAEQDATALMTDYTTTPDREQDSFSNDKESSISRTGQPSFYEEPQPISSNIYGFLNYRNSQKKEAARRQFEAWWGNRPLVDNWRRIEAVGAVVTAADNPIEMQSSDAVVAGIDQWQTQEVGAPIESSETTQQLMDRKLQLQYRLANLFLLTLNRADSAVVYYRKVAGGSNPDLAARASYALRLLSDMAQQADSTAFYRNRPAGLSASQEIGTDELLKKKVQPLLDHHKLSIPDGSRSQKLKVLALKNEKSPLAPAIYYEAIRAAIQSARADGEQPSAGELCEYEGAAWNHVVNLIDDFQQLFPADARNKQLAGWKQLLKEARNQCKE